MDQYGPGWGEEEVGGEPEANWMVVRCVDAGGWLLGE